MSRLKEHPGQYVSVPRAAEIAGVSVRTIGRMIADKALKAHKPRHQWRVSLASLKALMTEPTPEMDLEYDPLLH